MKRVEIGNKSFKVIPEARLVQGEMVEKSIEKDLKAGIKEVYKNLIRCASNNYVEDFNIVSLFNVVPNKIVANAYCDDNDEFDEKIGIDVCAEKLEMKNHIKLANILDRISRDLMDASLIAQSLCVKHDDKVKAIEEDLAKMYGRLEK